MKIMKTISRIRTGGQSGVDRAAMDFAREQRIPLCGWCPKNGWAEDYPDPPGLLADYPELTETPSAGTAQRTKWNMRDCDAILTIIPEGSAASPGTDIGLEEGNTLGKPMFTAVGEDDVPAIAEWIRNLPDGTELCIGGPRASECSKAYDVTRVILDGIAGSLADDTELFQVREMALTPQLLDDLIFLSEEWEKEESCHGYRKNKRSDIEGNRIFTAEHKSEIIGYLFGHLERSERTSSIMPGGTPFFEVEELYVKPEYRSKGIGQKLFLYAEDAVVPEAEYVMLSTATKNWRAIFHFYLDELGMEFWSARLFKRIG